MKAVILAAGYATRLYPLTLDRPKALLSVGGRPMLDWVCDNVEEICDDIHLVTNSRFADDFRRWASNCSSWRRMSFAVAGEPAMSMMARA